MKTIFILFLFVVAPTLHAQSQQPVKIYQTDRFGTAQKHLPGLVIIKDKVYQTDRFGTAQLHLPGMAIVNGTIYEMDRFGTPQMHKPVAKVSK